MRSQDTSNLSLLLLATCRCQHTYATVFSIPVALGSLARLSKAVQSDRSVELWSSTADVETFESSKLKEWNTGIARVVCSTSGPVKPVKAVTMAKTRAGRALGASDS